MLGWHVFDRTVEITCPTCILLYVEAVSQGCRWGRIVAQNQMDQWEQLICNFLSLFRNLKECLRVRFVSQQKLNTELLSSFCPVHGASDLLLTLSGELKAVRVCVCFVDLTAFLGGGGGNAPTWAVRFSILKISLHLLQMIWFCWCHQTAPSSLLWCICNTGNKTQHLQVCFCVRKGGISTGVCKWGVYEWRRECGIDRLIGTGSGVLQIPYQSVIVNTECEREAVELPADLRPYKSCW